MPRVPYVPRFQDARNLAVLALVHADEVSAFMKQLATDALYRDVVRTLEQGTPAWLKWREGRISGSVCADCVGHGYVPKGMNGPRAKTEDRCSEMLYSTFTGNAATEYGTQHEPYGTELRQVVAAFDDEEFSADAAGTVPPWHQRGARPRIFHEGAVIDAENPWLIVSSDGALHTPGGRILNVEEKNPFSRNLYPSVPPYYMDQMQFQMHILKLKRSTFWVYTPTVCGEWEVDYDADYWTHFMFPALKDYYFNFYLPRLILYRRGAFRKGQMYMDGICSLLPPPTSRPNALPVC